MADVQWTPVAGEGLSGVQTQQFHWTAKVVECFASDSARAAVVHAWPNEVASMDPTRPTGYSVLLETNHRLYRLHAGTRRQAVRLARQAARMDSILPTNAAVYLELPLAPGKRWDQDADALQRDDGWYCWHVEAVEQRSIRIHGMPRAKTVAVFRVAYRTNPDHELFEVAPGIGILRLEYEHHGTVASAAVRLLAIHRPRRPR